MSMRKIFASKIRERVDVNKLRRAHRYYHAGYYELALDISDTISVDKLSSQEKEKYHCDRFYCYLELHRYEAAETEMKKISRFTSFQWEIAELIYQVQKPIRLNTENNIDQANQELLERCKELRSTITASGFLPAKKAMYFSQLDHIENIILFLTNHEDELLTRILHDESVMRPEARVAQLALIARLLSPEDDRYHKLIDEVEKLKTKQNPDAWLLAARLWRDLGKEDKAMKNYQSLINHFPKYWGGYVEYAYTLSHFYQKFAESDRICQLLIAANNNRDPSQRPRAKHLYHTYQVLDHNDNAKIQAGLKRGFTYHYAKYKAADIKRDYKQNYGDQRDQTDCWTGFSTNREMWGVTYQDFNSNPARRPAKKIAEEKVAADLAITQPIKQKPSPLVALSTVRSFNKFALLDDDEQASEDNQLQCRKTH